MDSFAKMTGIGREMLEAVVQGRLALTEDMAVRIECALHYEKGFLRELQYFYDANQEKKKRDKASVTGQPDIRRSLFWDVDFDSIEWGVYRNAVIRRVLERGNEREKEAIACYYGLPREMLDRYKAENSYRIYGRDKKDT